MSILAYRVWTVDGAWLRSPIMRTHWAPGEPFKADRCAWCLFKPEYPNRERCSCGVWSFVDPVECATQAVWPLSKGVYVMGSVRCWGRLVPHERGQRSLWAEPARLFLWPSVTEGYAARVLAVAEAYSLPVDLAVNEPWFKAEFGVWAAQAERRIRSRTWSAKQPPEEENGE